MNSPVELAHLLNSRGDVDEHQYRGINLVLADRDQAGTTTHGSAATRASPARLPGA